VNVADRVNLGLLPSSEAGWHTACAALRSDCGGVLHIHATVTSRKLKSTPKSDELDIDNTNLSTSEQCSLTDIDSCYSSCNHTRTASSTETFPTNIGSVDTSAAKRRMTKFSKTRSAKPEWCDWADTVCQTLRGHLTALLHSDWSVSLRHIEHVKSYAPHIDHVVADIECRPSIAQN